MRKAFLTALISLMGVGAAFSQNNQAANSGSQGTASYYHNKFEGRKTATGEVFSNSNYTAASNVLPLGTFIKVTNLKNGKVVYVKVNDRMAPSNKRMIDVAEVVAKDLGFKNAGLAQVKMEVVSPDEGKRRILAQRNGDDSGSGTL